MDRITAMETFVSVVEAGSFSAAARRMNIGQPAVYKSVSKLKKKLGVRLLLRSTRGLSITDAGQKFYEHAKVAINKVDEAEQSISDSDQNLTGKLRISAAVTLARLHIIPNLNLFTEQHPNLDIDIILDDRQVDLIAEGADVALRMGTLHDSNMVARKIASSPRLIIGSPDYFAKAEIPKSPADLSQHQAIIYSQPAGGESWSLSKAGKEVSVTVSGHVSVNAAEGIRAAVLNGMGLTIASRWMFSKELLDGKVVSVLDDWTIPPVDLWAVFPSGRLISTKARAFVAFVEKVVTERIS